MRDRDRERIGRVGARQALEPDQRLHHARDLILGCGSRSGHRLLDQRGRIARDAQAGEPDHGQRHAARLRQRECAAWILMDEHILHRDHARRELADHLAQPARDLAEPHLHRLVLGRGQHAALDVAQLAAGLVDHAIAAHATAGVEPENSHAPPYSRALTASQILAARPSRWAISLGSLGYSDSSNASIAGSSTPWSASAWATCRRWSYPALPSSMSARSEPRASARPAIASIAVCAML